MRFSKFLQRSDNKYLKLYLKECGRVREEYPDQYDRNYLIKKFPGWLLSQVSGKTPLDARRPWLTENANRFLEENLEPGMHILEYGCGGSTLFFLDKGCDVTTVEHSRKWRYRVRDKLEAGQSERWKVHLIEKGDISTSDNIQSKERQYAQAPLDEYSSNTFDVILIDGYARETCLELHLKADDFNKYIIYDNSDRLLSGDLKKQLSGMKTTTYAGPTRYSMPFTETLVIEQKE